MGPGTTARAARRLWVIEARPDPTGPLWSCSGCVPQAAPRERLDTKTAALHHLAGHVRATAREPHLRLCQCREHGCAWHRRHRGCGGPLLLLLARTHGGRGWRLADVCRGCAAVTDHAAVVVTQTDPAAAQRPLAPRRSGQGAGLTADLTDADGAEQGWPWWDAQC